MVLPLAIAILALTRAAVAQPCEPRATFADGLRPTREVFISPNGDDSSGDGTRSQPFQSVRRAIREASPGVAIRLLPGTYPGDLFLEGIEGTAEAPVWLGGIAGAPELPRFAGGRQAMHFSRVRYLVLENMRISGAKQNGINIDDGTRYDDPEATRHLVLRGLHFENIGTGGNQDALKLSGVNDFAVMDCTFERTSAGGSAIDHVGCHRGFITRCHFRDIGGNAIQCKGGSADLVIHGNRFQNGGDRVINVGGSTGFTYFRPPLSKEKANVEAQRITVSANVFTGGNAPICFVGAVACEAVHNTIIKPERYILRILQETTSRDGFAFAASGGNRFVNNLILYDTDRVRSHVNIGSNTDPSSFIFSHNLWYAADRPARSKPRLPVVETMSVVGQAPRFVDAANGDFRLLPGSPGQGKGQPLPAVKIDAKGNCFHDPPSIGAMESATQ